MRNRFLLALCCVLVWAKEVRSENEYEIKKKGSFPFMAILYYPDETVVDATGNRFLRAAVLIKPEWLLSSAIDHSVLDNVPLGFPRKTLLARMGALTLDASFTLNEDDEEQEREVIQIVKPRNHNKESWWTTDITLLKTLIPFKLTSVVAPTAINPKRTYVDNNCAILFYSKKYGSTTDVKFLMQLGVQLMPASTENCGAHFSSATMTCASHDPAEDMKSIYDLEFCLGNNGGPLLCEGEVMALQTYIENNCKQPHLYQLLAPWDTLINCALEQKCNAKDDECNVCTSTQKDDPPVKTFPNNTQLHTIEKITGEAYLESSKIPENFVVENTTSLQIPKSTESITPTRVNYASESYLKNFVVENNTSLEISLSTESLSMTPTHTTVLEANHATVSYMTESNGLGQTISSLSNKSEANAPEQSSTSKKSQLSSSELSEILIQKMESPGLEKETKSPTSNIIVSTFSTLSWLETTQIEKQLRLMDSPDKKDENIDVTVQELPKSTKQTTKIQDLPKSTKQTTKIQELPKSTKQTTKIRKWPKKKPVNKANPDDGLKVHKKQTNQVKADRKFSKHHDNLKKYRHYQEMFQRVRKHNVEPLTRSETMSLVSGGSGGSGGAGNRDIAAPLILHLITLVFLI